MGWGSYYVEDVWPKSGVALASCLWACAFYEPFRDGLIKLLIVGVPIVC